ncbi:hypothetical protein GN956_G8931 [Arapaima gigas]
MFLCQHPVEWTSPSASEAQFKKKHVKRGDGCRQTCSLGPLSLQSAPAQQEDGLVRGAQAPALTVLPLSRNTDNQEHQQSWPAEWE